MNEYKWSQRYTLETERGIALANYINSKAIVRTHQMSAEEYEQFFGTKRESVHRLK